MNARIDQLNLSPHWKETFLAFEKAGPLVGLNFQNATQLSKPERKLVGFNLWAFFFGVFYYFQKGLYEKGILILGMGWFQGAILLLIPRILGGGMHPAAFWLPVAAICGVFGSYDYYRKMVYGDKLWDSFRTFEDPKRLYGFTAASLIAILTVVFF